MRRWTTPGYLLGYYVLDELRQPVPLRDDDTIAWGTWFERANRHVGSTYLKPSWWPLPAPRVHVSTVFLGLDHSHDLDGPPVLFETMVFADAPLSSFGRESYEYQHRYATWAEAEAGHWTTVELVRASFSHRRWAAYICRFIVAAYREHERAMGLRDL